jgi:hypothetical protein
MDKITCMSLSRGKQEAHYNDFSLCVFRSENGVENARLEQFYCRSPRRAGRITNLFIAWLIKAGNDTGVILQ